MASNYYHFLGVEVDADAATIKAAYRKLAKEYHPDLNQHDPHAEAFFKRVNRAYDVLSDPIKRREYDFYLTAGSKTNRTSTSNVEQNLFNFDKRTGSTFNNNRTYSRFNYSDVFMGDTKEQPRYKMSEIRWRGLPVAHYVVISGLALLFILVSAFSSLQNDLFIILLCWVILVIHTLMSSFWINNMTLTTIRSKPINWLGVLFIHVLVLPISIILGLVVTSFITSF